jgi:putative phosphoesterase
MEKYSSSKRKRTMKILIISDIHSNYEALLAVVHAEKADEILCLGDLVDFGPQPAECVQWVRFHVRHNCVRGNHDHALAFNVDCRSGKGFHELSELSRAMNRELLLPEQIEFLQRLPLTKSVTLDRFRFHLSHATPDGDLYKNHLQPDISDEALAVAVESIDADFVLCGHTHMPMIRKIGTKTFINPGSVGLPLDGDPRASYAVFHDGKVRLRRVKYAVTETVARLYESTLPSAAAAQMAEILCAGYAGDFVIPDDEPHKTS